MLIADEGQLIELLLRDNKNRLNVGARQTAEDRSLYRTNASLPSSVTLKAINDKKGRTFPKEWNYVGK